VKKIATGIRKLYRRYPARCNTLIAAAVVGGLGLAGVAVDVATVKGIVALEVPILLAGEATHHRVSPTTGE
jgi:hypothetical protein